ncbi:MAG: single-stranded-DNA-specific exonuclease RecJ [Desulfobulbales bacterium]|nr:single-stranded-DNA-specific exonuclease RecJ [Desulfobulbales bacterium]
MIARILAYKGFTDIEDIRNFLNPSLRQLPRPQLLKGMAEAVPIMQQALKHQKPVTVFGDFDADGVSSTALLSLFFRELGVRLHFYIPDRLTEGYGLNLGAIRKIYEHNTQRWGEAGILITVDCGISDVEVVEEAITRGFSVIITDHHRPPGRLPRAHAIINPLQSGCPFPFKNLAGVGVAFYLILGMRADLVANEYWPEDRIPNLKSYMDLVAIGTVADQVPLSECNRILVKAGLEILNQCNRVGLQKLLDNARNYDTTINVEDIAFRMAPRINAAGRIGSAHKALKLMTTNVPEEAEQYADELEEANAARKGIENRIFEQAAEMASPEMLANENSLVLYNSDWHQGVLGIVASRLSDHFNRPTILLTDYSDGEESREVTFMKGSGRSVNGLDIHRAVTECQEVLERFGGHEGAVGLTMLPRDFDCFRTLFDRAIATQKSTKKLPAASTLMLDGAISLQELGDSKFLAAYSMLSPFGRGNEEPVFYMKGQKLLNMREVGRNHLRFTVQDNGRFMSGIGFNLAHHLPLAQNNLVDLAFTLRFKSYRGNDSWEIHLLDIKPAGESNL